MNKNVPVFNIFVEKKIFSGKDNIFSYSTKKNFFPFSAILLFFTPTCKIFVKNDKKLTFLRLKNIYFVNLKAVDLNFDVHETKKSRCLEPSSLIRHPLS